jgi:hypothetical protein
LLKITIINGFRILLKRYNELIVDSYFTKSDINSSHNT